MEIFRTLLLTILFLPRVQAAVDTSVASALGNVLTISNDKESIRPVSDISLALDVDVAWNLVSIPEVDEINGLIGVSGYLTLEWTATAFDVDIGYTDTENIPNDKIWKPPIVLVNSLEFYDIIGADASMNIEYNFNTRKCVWKPWVITKVSCLPNVRYYPFDKQECALTFAVWGYSATKVTLSPKRTEWGFDFFQDNGEWKVGSSTAEKADVSGVSAVDFKIEVVRRPTYYIINLIAPLILLGVVNSFAFILPIRSGERISFAVTCFLAYVVLLNAIMALLPTSGTPISFLSYYTLVMMVISAAETLMSILSVRVYYRKDDTDLVPGLLARFYRFCRRKWHCAKRCKNANEVTDLMPASASTLSSTDDNEPVTWPMFVSYFDFLLFCAFLLGQVIFSVCFLLPFYVVNEVDE